MRRTFIFPVFNTVVGTIAGAALGFFLGPLLPGLLVGAASGFLLAAAIEWAFGKDGARHWLYRRRALLVVLLEIPIAMFVVGPYVYVGIMSQPAHHVVCCETPLDYGALSYEQVRVQTPDGVTLAGWYVPPRQTPGPVVILLHGSGGDRRGSPWQARDLIAAGYGELMYDQRGLGESTGDTISLGWQHRGDLLAIVRYLQQRPDVDPGRIAALGLSRGAHVALNTAYLQPDCFAGLWLDGMGAQRMEDYPDARNGAEQFELALDASTLKMGELRSGERLPPGIGQMLREMDRPPMMLVASGLDDFERRAHEKVVRSFGPNEEGWVIENAWHTGGPVVVPDEYRQRMLSFFAKAFEKPAGQCGSD